MPTLISRDEALARIRVESGHPLCMLCAVVDRRAGPVLAVYEDDDALVMLPRYVRRWGHAMVLPKDHVPLDGAMDPALWAHINALALRTARVIERARRPARCYVASASSGASEIAQTAAQHAHVHVVPLYDRSDEPAAAFSWDEGVYVAERAEWDALRQQYVDAWGGSGESATMRPGA